MKQTLIRWQWMALIPALLLLHGCGSGGGSGTVPIVPTNTRVVTFKLVDAQSKQTVSGAVIRLYIGGTAMPFKQVVNSLTDANTQILIEIAKGLNPNAQAGDYILSDLPASGTYQGIWIQRPAGYTSIVVHRDPRRTTPRIIQLPDSPIFSAGCLIAADRQASDFPVGATSLGSVEIYASNSSIPPPPPDENCP
jgi:hypothetical protein